MANRKRAVPLACTALIVLALVAQAVTFKRVDGKVGRSAGVLIERFIPDEDQPPPEEDEDQRLFLEALSISKVVHNGLWSLFGLEFALLAITAVLLWHSRDRRALRARAPSPLVGEGRDGG